MSNIIKSKECRISYITFLTKNISVILIKRRGITYICDATRVKVVKEKMKNSPTQCTLHTKSLFLFLYYFHSNYKNVTQNWKYFLQCICIHILKIFLKNMSCVVNNRMSCKITWKINVCPIFQTSTSDFKLQKMESSSIDPLYSLQHVLIWF